MPECMEKIENSKSLLGLVADEIEQNASLCYSGDVHFASSGDNADEVLFDNLNILSEKVISAIDRQQLLSSLNRVRVFGKSVEDMLLVNIELGDTVTLSTTNLLSQSTKEQILAQYSGEALSLDFNCKHLINCLSRLSVEIVYLHFKDEKSAFIITESEKEYGETLMLAMPHKI